MAQDPQWGRRNDGPPDLEEIARRLLNRLKQFFGGRPGSPLEPQSTGPDGKVFGSGIAIVAVAAFLLWIASGFYIVQPSEKAVVLTFGKYAGTTDSGPHWRFPWPIGEDQIVKVSVIRSVGVGYMGDSKSRLPEEALMLTEDQNIVDMQLEVQYDIKSAHDFVFNIPNLADDGNRIVKQAAESAIREVVGRNKIDFILNEGRGQVAADTTRLIQKLLDEYRTGIHVARVNMKSVQPPDAVQAAFADAVKAGQDRAKQVNEGNAYAQDILPRVQGTAAALALQAEGYKQAVIARAEGDADRFKQIQAQYAKAPRVTRDRMYLDAMEQMYSNTTKVYVDEKASNNLLYLPLDKLIQANGAAVTPTTVAPSAGTVAGSPADIRSADSGSAGDGRGGPADYAARGQREGR